jgi:hypothetical protein
LCPYKKIGKITVYVLVFKFLDRRWKDPKLRVCYILTFIFLDRKHKMKDSETNKNEISWNLILSLIL